MVVGGGLPRPLTAAGWPLTRGQAESLRIAAGTTVWLRAAAGASTLDAPAQEEPVPVPA